MKQIEKNIIKSMVDLLKQLDPNSLSLLFAGAQMLKARQDMEKTEKTAG